VHGKSRNQFAHKGSISALERIPISCDISLTTTNRPFFGNSPESIDNEATTHRQPRDDNRQLNDDQAATRRQLFGNPSKI
jgi:hypothetical protein